MPRQVIAWSNMVVPYLFHGTFCLGMKMGEEWRQLEFQ